MVMYVVSTFRLTIKYLSIAREILLISDKIDSLTKTCDHLYKKFEEIISRADPTKFDELSVAVSEAQALKRKANEQTGDIEKLRESLDILKVKRKKL